MFPLRRRSYQELFAIERDVTKKGPKSGRSFGRFQYLDILRHAMLPPTIQASDLPSTIKVSKSLFEILLKLFEILSVFSKFHVKNSRKQKMWIVPSEKYIFFSGRSYFLRQTLKIYRYKTEPKKSNVSLGIFTTLNEENKNKKVPWLNRMDFRWAT